MAREQIAVIVQLIVGRSGSRDDAISQQANVFSWRTLGRVMNCDRSTPTIHSLLQHQHPARIRNYAGSAFAFASGHCGRITAAVDADRFNKMQKSRCGARQTLNPIEGRALSGEQSASYFSLSSAVGRR